MNLGSPSGVPGTTIPSLPVSVAGSRRFLSPAGITAGLLLLGAAPWAYGLQMGESRKMVIAEKGNPVTVTENDEKAILRFADGIEVTFLNDEAISWETGKQAKGYVASKPTVVPLVPTPTDEPITPVAPRRSLRAIRIRPPPPPPVSAREQKAAVAAVGVGLLFGVVLFRLFFRGMADFFGCLNIRNAGHSPLSIDWWWQQRGFFKLALYFLVSIGAGMIYFELKR